MSATITSRTKIGFPKQKEEWANAPAVYSKHTLRIANHPVMEDWELGYMNILAKIATSKKGNVLELGFGLGLSARAIQQYPITSHYIIECHPDVVAKCIKDFHDEISKSKLHILSGFWQDITPMLASKSFEGMLFDTYPLKAEEIHANHFWFFTEAYRLLKPGGVLTYYSDEAVSFSDKHLKKLNEAGFKTKNIDFEIVEVNPPKNCEYWQEKTLLAPIVIK